jgi:hypothetical protein
MSWFSLPLLCETFLIPRRIERNMIKNVQVDRCICGFSIRGLPRPEKIWKIKEVNGSQFSKRASSENGPLHGEIHSAQRRPILGPSSFVPVHTLPRKLATILLLAFSLFELVAALSQCLCSESNKKNREVGEYPKQAMIFF